MAPWTLLAGDRAVGDGGGGSSAAGALHQVTALAQPGVVGLSAGGGLHHAAGFLHVFQLASPATLAREVNPDNDGDGLWDDLELTGSGFDPVTTTDLNTADTDGDGASDQEEAVAGTNPRDAEAFLHVSSLSLAPDSPDCLIKWDARAGRNYRVIASSSLSPLLPFTTLAELRAPASGLGPWQVVPVEWTNNVPDPGLLFISLRLVP